MSLCTLTKISFHILYAVEKADKKHFIAFTNSMTVCKVYCLVCWILCSTLLGGEQPHGLGTTWK